MQPCWLAAVMPGLTSDGAWGHMPWLAQYSQDVLGTYLVHFPAPRHTGSVTSDMPSYNKQGCLPAKALPSAVGAPPAHACSPARVGPALCQQYGPRRRADDRDAGARGRGGRCGQDGGAQLAAARHLGELLTGRTPGSVPCGRVRASPCSLTGGLQHSRPFRIQARCHTSMRSELMQV